MAVESPANCYNARMSIISTKLTLSLAVQRPNEAHKPIGFMGRIDIARSNDKVNIWAVHRNLRSVRIVLNSHGLAGLLDCAHDWLHRVSDRYMKWERYYAMMHTADSSPWPVCKGPSRPRSGRSISGNSGLGLYFSALRKYLQPYLGCHVSSLRWAKPYERA